MKYAITPQGTGQKPAARATDDTGALLPGESFAVPEGGYDPSLVLAEDGASLRAQTPEDLAGEEARARIAQLKAAAEVAVRDKLLEAEALKADAPQAVKD